MIANDLEKVFRCPSQYFRFFGICDNSAECISDVFPIEKRMACWAKCFSEEFQLCFVKGSSKIERSEGAVCCQIIAIVGPDLPKCTFAERAKMGMVGFIEFRVPWLLNQRQSNVLDRTWTGTHTYRYSVLKKCCRNLTPLPILLSEKRDSQNFSIGNSISEAIAAW